MNSAVQWPTSAEIERCQQRAWRVRLGTTTMALGILTIGVLALAGASAGWPAILWGLGVGFAGMGLAMTIAYVPTRQSDLLRGSGVVYFESATRRQQLAFLAMLTCGAVATALLALNALFPEADWALVGLRRAGPVTFVFFAVGCVILLAAALFFDKLWRDPSVSTYVIDDSAIMFPTRGGRHVLPWHRLATVTVHGTKVEFIARSSDDTYFKSDTGHISPPTSKRVETSIPLPLLGASAQDIIDEARSRISRL